MVYINSHPLINEFARWSLTAICFFLAVYCFLQAYKSYKIYSELKEKLRKLDEEIEEFRKREEIS